MLKWLISVLLILAVFNANADADFFVIPVKTIRFLHKSNKTPLPIKTYVLSYASKFDCTNANCDSFRANSSSSTEVSGGLDTFETLPMKIPRMRESGPLVLTFSVPGVCRQLETCSAKMSYDKFIAAEEPVIFSFDYDDSASKALKKKKKKAEADSLAEIEEKLGKNRHVSSLPEVDVWKKFGDDFVENRKKLNPMSYSKDSVAKLGLNTWRCNKSLQDKIGKCDVHACIYDSEIKGVKLDADLIIHGFNKVGNCAISLPGGKRFFVPKAELVYFYDSFISTLSAGMEMMDPCQSESTLAACREKKTDLLFQLHNRQLATDYVPVQIGIFTEK